MKDNNKIKYFAYLRKSSESEDRQMQSIDSQRAELQNLVNRLDLDVIEYFEESQSAKMPGRPIFNEMIRRLREGEASGLLCWKINRLARNPIDGGMICWLLDRGIVQNIQTSSGQHLPTDNSLIMNVELGTANQFIKDLSTDTKRGLRERRKRGYTTGVASIGYLNDLSQEPGARGWIKDRDRFLLIKQMLNYYADGIYSVKELLHKAEFEWGLTTPQRKSQGGKPIARSYLYKILSNPVYAGHFYGPDGTEYDLNSSIERMISRETHEKILQRMGKTNNPRSSKNENIYAPHGECGTCKKALVMEKKRRVRCDCGHKFSYITQDTCKRCGTRLVDMESPKFYDFDYIHCTKSHKKIKCTESTITLDDFTLQLSNYLEENLFITAKLAQWCLKHVKELDDAELANTVEIATARSSALEQAQKKYSNLLERRVAQLSLSVEQESQYDDLEKKLLNDIERFKGTNTEYEKIHKRFTKITNDFNLALEIAEIIKNGTNGERKEILSSFDSKLILTDRKLSVEPRKPLKVMIEGFRAYRTNMGSFETKNPLDKQEDLVGSDLKFSSLLTVSSSELLDSLPRKAFLA